MVFGLWGGEIGWEPQSKQTSTAYTNGVTSPQKKVPVATRFSGLLPHEKSAPCHPLRLALGEKIPFRSVMAPPCPGLIVFIHGHNGHPTEWEGSRASVRMCVLCAREGGEVARRAANPTPQERTLTRSRAHNRRRHAYTHAHADPHAHAVVNARTHASARIGLVQEIHTVRGWSLRTTQLVSISMQTEVLVHSPTHPPTHSLIHSLTQ